MPKQNISTAEALARAYRVLPRVAIPIGKGKRSARHRSALGL